MMRYRFRNDKITFIIFYIILLFLPYFLLKYSTKHTIIPSFILSLGIYIYLIRIEILTSARHNEKVYSPVFRKTKRIYTDKGKYMLIKIYDNEYQLYENKWMYLKLIGNNINITKGIDLIKSDINYNLNSNSNNNDSSSFNDWDGNLIE